jgi:protein-disulfide isomerase
LLEAYFDFQCPDSAASWPIIKQVLQHYGPHQLQFVMHMLALPYHHNSFLLQKAGAVAADVKEELIWKWTDLIFANQQSFYNSPTANKSMNQVISQIGDLITQIGVSKSQLVQGMSDSNIDSASRVSWKFATSKGMYGTPMFAVNGVTTNAGSDWTFAQWTQLLDPLFQSLNNKKKKQQQIL